VSLYHKEEQGHCHGQHAVAQSGKPLDICPAVVLKLTAIVRFAAGSLSAFAGSPNSLIAQTSRRSIARASRLKWWELKKGADQRLLPISLFILFYTLKV
jgi:hypothetical protein